MDLPERAMTSCVRSRLGMIAPDLEQIVKARLVAAAASLHGHGHGARTEALKFSSMRFASISGDARHIIHWHGAEPVRPATCTTRTEDMSEVIKEVQNSPTKRYLRELAGA
ncbi:uncharacterized protein BXZ73DRAFT_79956 [Epithele typhae]|uniref:uncharacterized protein n=1 Tax=Epithele typhae TaxID=378194 RepID=UPI00200816F1|nr:uncharacterized protein BXZ73DRAFT_79956 [Epithele typhae]KAH9921175.1 hypothetical protein BXZ73DRAFT_79956 [Epithele typhae]